MFMSLFSPKGGRPLADIAFRKTKPTLNIKIEKRAEVINDFYCWRIGYDEEGKEIFIKPSCAVELYRFLKKELKNA